MRTTMLFLASCLLAACLGCEIGPRSGRGLRLPEGDLESGALAFRQLGCPECHDVDGEPVPPKGERSDMIVRLGGRVAHIETHGELVTSIVNPSHDISHRYRYPSEGADGSPPRMKNFNQEMTVAQLIDLTAFLQSKYEIRQPRSIR
jgi:hypothetical protein